MELTPLERLIVDRLDALQGCKATELVSDVAVHAIENGIDLMSVDLVETIYRMAKDGKVREVEYCLPGSPRCKSFFLPAGTRVSLDAERDA